MYVYHYKIIYPFSKVILPSALQIKLWGREDLENISENSLSQILLKTTKFSSHFIKIQYMMPSQKYKKSWSMYVKNLLDVHIWYSILDKTISIQYTHNKITNHTSTPLQKTPSPLCATCYNQLRLKNTTCINKREISPYQTSYQDLIQSICSHNMSQRPTSYISGQRYKEVMLALEDNPEAETSVTQTRPSNEEGTSNHKRANLPPS